MPPALLLAAMLALPTHAPADSGAVLLLAPLRPAAKPTHSYVHALAPGDIVLYRRRNIPQNLLYRLFLSGGMTHVGIVVARPDGSLGLLEAVGVRYPVVISDLRSRLCYFDGPVYVRRRCVPLRPDQSARLTAFACGAEGKRFDVVGLLGPALSDPVWHRPGSCIQPSDLDPRRWYCSPLVLGAAVAAGLIDPCLIRLRRASPQDLFEDRSLDLRPYGWESPAHWLHDAPPTRTWWSRSCTGEVKVWP